MFLSLPIIFSKSLALSSTLDKDKVLQVVFIFESFDYFSGNIISLDLSNVVKIS